MLRPRSAYGSHRNPTIERHQSTSVLHGEREQVDVGELLRAENARVVDELFVEQRNIVGPEGVIGSGDLVRQKYDHVRNSHWLRVSGLRCDTHKSILRKRTRRPAFRAVCRPPLMCWRVMNMIRLKQCKQHTHVE